MNKNPSPSTNFQELWHGKRVLIVDDNPPTLVALQKIYESLGFTIAGTAQDGVEALSKYEELRPDLVSLDIIMPNMHGIECYRLLRGKNPNLKILFISCLAKDRQVSSSYDGEIPEHLFVAKPVDVNILSESLSRIFG